MATRRQTVAAAAPDRAIMLNTPLPALTLHGLHDHAGDSGSFDGQYSWAPARFQGLLDALARSGHVTRVITALADEPRAPADDRRPILLTFDDGDISAIEVALPMLAERNMCAGFYITTDWIGAPGRMTANHLREIAAAGMDVQSHTCSHRYLDDLTEADIRAELYASRVRLEDMLGQPVIALALPGGRGDARVRRIAAEVGYRLLFTSRPGINGPGTDPMWLHRLSVYRDSEPDTLVDLARGKGLRYQFVCARHNVLAAAKHCLGNQRYEHMRARLLSG